MTSAQKRSNVRGLTSATYHNPVFTNNIERTDEEETDPKTAYSQNDNEDTRPKRAHSTNDSEETHPKRTDSLNDDDETHPKIISSLNDQTPPTTSAANNILNNGNARPSGITWGDITNQQDGCSATTCAITEKEQRRGNLRLKFLALTVLILGAIIVVIIIIIVLRDSSPPDAKDKYVCTALGVNLGDSVIIVCNTSVENVGNISIKSPSTASLNKTILLTNQTRTNEGWTMNYTPKQNITLKGPQAKCSSAGKYNISISDTDKSSSSSQIVSLEINVDPELVADSDLNMTKSNCSKEAQCMSRTQCQDRYRLHMVPSIYPATVFSQICYTNYSDSTGWTSLCRGPTQTDILNVSYTVECMLSDTKLTITKNITIC